MSARADEFQKCRVFSSDQILFPDISYTSFVYPGDEEALAVLRRVPGAPTLLIFLQKNFTEEVTFLENNLQMIRASAHSFSSLHKLVVRCSEILSCPVPDVYVTNNPFMGASTTGQRHTSIVLNSSLVEGMTADELSFVVGHELGHIKCGHGLYRQLGSLVLQYWDEAASAIALPGITTGMNFLRYPLMIAYWEWFRRAELTCDRAGLLCVQAAEPALTALGRLAGKISGFEDEFNIDSVTAQAVAHKEVNKLALIVSIINNAGNTHPFVPSRLKELRDYSQSAEYQKVLHGQYERDPLGLHEGGLRIPCPCGEEVNIKLAFCWNCGRPVVSESAPDSAEVSLTCLNVNCKAILAGEGNYCTRCGTKQESARAPEKTGVLSRLFKRHN